MIHHETADTAEEIARILRKRGRTVVHAPSRTGKTTELIRYAEERYPNGRFAVVCDPAKEEYIKDLHWRVCNGISFTDIVAKRLLGEKLTGEEVNAPKFLIRFPFTNASPWTPVFVDEYGALPKNVRRAISRRQLFVGAVTSEYEEIDDAEES